MSRWFMCGFLFHLVQSGFKSNSYIAPIQGFIGILVHIPNRYFIVDDSLYACGDRQD